MLLSSSLAEGDIMNKGLKFNFSYALGEILAISFKKSKTGLS